MDKYTVDLDQVLNDFEYSELTDQYNSASRSTAGTTSLNQNTITKHSINNVFHSLNEYLNTNISVNSFNQIDNNLLLENKENYVGDVNTLNLSQNRFIDEEKSINDCNLKTDALLLDFNGKTNENNNVSYGEVRSVEDGNDAVDFIDTDVYSEELCVEKDVTEGNLTNGNEKEQNILDKTEEKTDVYIKENNGQHISEAVDCNRSGTPETSDIAVLPVTDNASESENEYINICDTNSSVEVDKLEEKTVGFDDDLELDESEVNKLLDELDDEELESNEECKSQTIKDLSHDTTCGSENEANVCQMDDKQCKDNTAFSVQASNQVIETEVELPVEENIVTKDEITNNKDMRNGQSDESLNFSELADPSSEDKEKVVTAESGIETIEAEIKTEPIVSDKSTEIVEDLREQQQDGSVEDKMIVQENEELEIEKENSMDSLSRPQNLPLNGEGEPPKRKINLIGDPGSTPYNNVYINKEIPKSKQKTYDSDTDYSTSSSPTFSDASSTTSTVSIDVVHNESDNTHIKSKDIAEPACKEFNDIEQASTITSLSCMEASSNKTENQSVDSQNPTSDVTNPTSDVTSQPSDIGSTVSDETVTLELAPQESSNIASDIVLNPQADTQEDAEGAGASHVENLGEVNVSGINIEKQWLGKEAPLWVPDADALSCLHCDMKFTVLKRRHHCRACGLVLCSKCCHLRFRLEYLDAEARVCNKCHNILNKDTNSSSGSDVSPDVGNSPSHRPNPNNPLEYCSTVSPLQQVAGSNLNPPAVMVPVGVLKRKGSNKSKSNKSVMFCDGIRPGSDLTNLDNDFNYSNIRTKKSEKTSGAPAKPKRNLPTVDRETNTFIPSSENSLPPTVTVSKTDISYTDCQNGPDTVEILKNEQLTFALHVNLYVHVKIISMSCCINKTVWCFSTEGLINVGQDEIVFLVEYIDEESFVPKDVFFHIINVHNDAVKGTSVKELGLSLHNTSNFLDSKNHAGFVYIRPTFQCLENIVKPKEPFLIGILIHRWETPWAKLFPLRLVLRLGAEYRYYPSPIISTRHRESVFVEIGHTIINLLADFRNFSYTLPQIRGLMIHMEDKNTTITIPANRYDQVMKSMSNSSDHILAFAGNFSQQADSHLVCIQDTQGNENCYSTHAINIHNQPRKVTGASFIVFNGALKSTSGLTAKSNIVEDGLMIQVLPEHMQQIRDSLRAMKNHTISCGCVNAASDETVSIEWGENDVNFNVGVVSAIDNTPLGGIPSIRVHNAKNHVCVNGSRIIRWTEVFIIQNGDDNPKNQDSVDISRVSESIGKATCDALVKYLDLLVANNCQKIGIRTTLHVDNVSYLAGSNGSKLPPIYMKSLDNELIPVLHRITTNNLGEHSIVLELIFRILNV